jgi:hypothetical protein
MTTDQQVVTPAAPSQFGECLLVIDEKKEIVCGLPAVGEKLVKNDFGLFSIGLCAGHTREHREFYERLRRSSNRPRRR